MAINTKFMGIELSSPLIVGSSSLTNTTDNLKRAEDCGAGAVVIKSLFEEQILADSGRDLSKNIIHSWYPEAVKNINDYSENQLIEHYFNLIDFAKSNLQIPVFASVNCISSYEWPQFALKFEEAGADGIELNIAVSPADEASSGEDVISNITNIITAVRSNCSIPVAVKLSPFFTNLNTALKNIDETGVDGLVLFNRLFTPNIDIDSISVLSESNLSTVSDINTGLRWITLLSDRLKADMIGSGGIHDHKGVIQYILAGAKGVQVTSSLMLNGMDFITELNKGLGEWMNEKGFDSIEDFRGLISKDISNKNQFKRIQYLRFD